MNVSGALLKTRVKYTLFSFPDAASARDDSDESGEAGDPAASTSAAAAAYTSCEYSSGPDDFFIFFDDVAMIALV